MSARTTRIAAVSAAGIVVLASAYYFISGSRGGASKQLPAFDPPVYPAAVMSAEQSDEVKGGRQHIRIYSVKAGTETLLDFYRKELTARGLHLAAQGGGPYGGFLQAADDSGNRAVFVEVDAPEDKLGEPAKITIRVVDKK